MASVQGCSKLGLRGEARARSPEIRSPKSDPLRRRDSAARVRRTSEVRNPHLAWPEPTREESNRGIRGILGKGLLIVLGFRVFRVFRGSRPQPSWIQLYEDEAKEIRNPKSEGGWLAGLLHYRRASPKSPAKARLRRSLCRNLCRPHSESGLRQSWRQRLRQRSGT